KEVVAVERRYFAIKANPHPQILRALVEEGFGLECVSLGELRHVFAMVPGIDPAKVLFTPSFAPRAEYAQARDVGMARTVPSFAPIAEYAQALEMGVTVTVDNVELLRRWPETFRGRQLWLRIDLGHGDGHHQKVNTGGKEAKFGLSAQRVDEFAEEARALGVVITGLHAHLGSGVETMGHWRLMCDELAGFARRIGTVATLDIGGGLPIPYAAEDEPFDIEAWAAGLAEVRALHPAFGLVIEPGRFLVAEAGVLLAR